LAVSLLVARFIMVIG